MTAELKRISHELLNSRNTQDEINFTHELGLFYTNMLRSLNIKANSIEYTNIIGGIALSPQHAIDCLEDGVRTSRFLKGVYQALQQVQKATNTRPTEILYAGCGPFATLIIPLLVHFEAHQFKITLIDIHEESILSVKKIIEHLNLSEFNIDYKTCDATKYEHHSKIDVLISETMDKGLTNEPQVSISEHLCNYLSPEGVLIPKQISVYSGTSVFSTLPNRTTHLHVNHAADLIDYTHLLFSINRNSKISNQGFESEAIPFQKDAQLNPDICIYTEIEVFDGVFLAAGEAQITDPICLPNPHNSTIKQYSLVYSTKPSPIWKIK